jgi:hypothetical protein
MLNLLPKIWLKIDSAAAEIEIVGARYTEAGEKNDRALVAGPFSLAKNLASNYSIRENRHL